MNAELKPFDFVLIGYLCLLTLLNWSIETLPSISPSTNTTI